MKEMRRISSRLCALLFVFVAACGSSSSPRSSSERSSADWATIDLGSGYRLCNNVWNKSASLTDTTPFQEIFYDKGEEPSFGWQWSWSLNNTTVVAYPEIKYGTSPWDGVGYGTSADVPFLAGSKTLTASYNLSLEAGGKYNLAFDLWAVTDLSGETSSISHEIMVWTDHSSGLTPAGSQIDTVTVGGVPFAVWTRPNHGDASGGSTDSWYYIAFVAATPILDGSLELSAFINYMIEQGIMTPEHYIVNVELGNEVFGGQGTCELSEYALTFE